MNDATDRESQPPEDGTDDLPETIARLLGVAMAHGATPSKVPQPDGAKLFRVDRAKVVSTLLIAFIVAARLRGGRAVHIEGLVKHTLQRWHGSAEDDRAAEEEAAAVAALILGAGDPNVDLEVK